MKHTHFYVTFIVFFFVNTHAYAMNKLFLDENEEAFYANYETINTLPTLPLTLSDGGNARLVIVTRKNVDYLEALDSSLMSHCQCRPRLSMENSIQLFKGNKDQHSHRGWFIEKFDKNDELKGTLVGFISYSYQRNDYLDERNPDLSLLKDKTCFEIEWFVQPKFQKQGLATAALKEVIKYAKDATQEKVKIDYMVAVIRRNNELSKTFTKKHGFNDLGGDPKTNQELWVLPLAQ